jgi:pimeloyl-ACP methyl ester carboxylesterase
MSTPHAARLDPKEELFHVPAGLGRLRLLLRAFPAAGAARGVVLYVHGATFPSALSIAHRFDGQSWRDALAAEGFAVWGLDFLGFGGSDRYPEMAEPAAAHPPLGGAEPASRQIESAVRFICAHHAVPRLSIIAHSWGTIATGRFAARCPELVDRLVLFGPIARRAGSAPPPASPAWRLVTLEDQWQRFTAEVPEGETPVLARRHFEPWGEAYLDSDPGSRGRTPASVKVPNGPAHDIAAAWAGDLAYDPGLIRAPVAIIRGAWDTLVSDADAAWLLDALAAAPVRRDIKIARGTHLMHLEEQRHALHREATAFLSIDG